MSPAKEPQAASPFSLSTSPSVPSRLAGNTQERWTAVLGNQVCPSSRGRRRRALSWVVSAVVFAMLASSARAVSQLPLFELSASPAETLVLRGVARPGVPFDKIGRKFAFLGYEDGSFEAWAFPLKLVRSFRFSFLLPGSTTPVPGDRLVRTVEVTPAVTTLTYVHPLFTARLKFVVPPDESGGLILVNVDAIKAMSLICSFHPVLQPMWPAGLGGQFAWWNDELHAYVISEPTGRQCAFVGSPLARKISSTPAHTLSGAPHEFELRIEKPDSFRGHWFPIILAGGKGSYKTLKATYRKLEEDPVGQLEKSRAHFAALLDSTLHLDTPDTALNQAVEWAKVSLDNLVVTNPDLGTGLVAGWGPSGSGGRPGFGWFFGGDAFINSFSLTGLGQWEAVRDALAFFQRYQRKDGKMPHEISQAAGYLDWFGDYHYAFIHADTTPFYLVAFANYVRQTGDTAFLRTSWPSIEKAYRWCLSTDRNGDGLMDNKAAGLGALEYGSMTGIQTDVYLAAVWMRAVQDVAYLARVIGKEKLAESATKRAERLNQVFDRSFWNPSSSQYAYAFDAKGMLVDEVTPWCAVASLWRFGTPERRLASVRRIARADLTADWGIRMLSTRSARYEPLNYNYGAVWPFLSGWVTTADFRNGLLPTGLQNLRATVALVYENNLGHVNEVFSGATHIWPQASVPHQGFSTTGYVLPVLWGLLGVEADAPARRLTFAPAFPASWDRVRVGNLKVGRAQLNLRVERRRGMLRLVLDGQNARGLTFEFTPLLGPGVEIQGVRVNGKTARASVRETPRYTRLAVAWTTSGHDTVTIRFLPTVQPVPPRTRLQLGDRSHGVRFVDVFRDGDTLTLVLQAPAGKKVTVPLVNPELVTGVEGGVLIDGKLQVTFPEGEGYVERTVKIRVKA